MRGLQIETAKPVPECASKSLSRLQVLAEDGFLDLADPRDRRRSREGGDRVVREVLYVPVLESLVVVWDSFAFVMDVGGDVFRLTMPHSLGSVCCI